MTDKVKITLIRSCIGRPEKHRKILQSLGLHKRNKTVEHNNTPQISGMIMKVNHLLKVENLP